jgi:hypothetical protein
MLGRDTGQIGRSRPGFGRVAEVLLLLSLCLTHWAPLLIAEPEQLYEPLQALLRLGVPVGIVLGPGETPRMTAQATTGDTREPEGTRQSAEAPLSRAEVVGWLVQRWNKLFEVDDSEEVVNILSKSAGVCRGALERRIKGTTLSGPVFQVFFDIGTTFDDSLKDAPPRGLFGAPGETWETVQREIFLDTGSGTLRQALNRFAWTAPGIGWYAEESCPREEDAPSACRCLVGLVTEDSISTTAWDACVGISCPG